MIDDPAFLSFLQSEESRSLDGSLLEEVECAIRSYNGELYGDEEEGLSQVVTRDVAETIDWMVPSIARTIMSSDRVCEIEADSEEGREAAEQATEKLHDDMRRTMYELIVDWIKAGCLEKIGIVKTCVERRRVRKEGIVPELMIPDEAIAAEETGEFDEYGDALWKVAVLEEQPVYIRDYNVPIEEFRFSPDARNFEDAIYLAHIVEKTESDLVAMGFDRELVKGLQSYRTTINDFRDDGASFMGQDRTGATRKLFLNEEYVFYDLDDDGIAERLKVHRVGNEILEVSKTDYQPFEYWVPFRMPGRLIGHSLADKVVDLQRQTTVLKRNALNSLYFSTAPGTYIDESFIGDNTIDDLLNVRPGRIVRTKGGVPVPETRNDSSAVAFAAIQQLQGERESRTGITRMNQGLDADALNKTASGTAMMQAAGQLIEESLAREFAGALARLFDRKYRLMREYGEPFNLRVDGEYKQVDPKQWPENVDIKIRVGLGSGKKDQRLAYRRELGQYQALLLESGSPIVNAEVIYKNLAGLTRDMGFAPNELFVDPSTVQQPQQEQPDPEMVKAQMQMQIEQMKAEQKAQLDAANHELEQQKAMAKHELEQAKAFDKANLDSAKAQHQATLERARLAFEMREAEIKREFEQRLSAQKAAFDAHLSKNRDGGDLDK